LYQYVFGSLIAHRWLFFGKCPELIRAVFEIGWLFFGKYRELIRAVFEIGWLFFGKYRELIGAVFEIRCDLSGFFRQYLHIFNYIYGKLQQKSLIFQ